MAPRKSTAAATVVDKGTGLDVDDQKLADDIMREFLDRAQWSELSAEQKRAEFDAIEEQIAALQQRIQQLETSKTQFENREEVARGIVVGLVKLLTPVDETARKQILETVCVKMNVPRPKVTRRKKLTIATELLTEVTDVMDREGMTFVEIKKALPAGTQIDGSMLSNILSALVSSKKIGSQGERRSKKYFLLGEPEEEEEELFDEGKTEVYEEEESESEE